MAALRQAPRPDAGTGDNGTADTLLPIKQRWQKYEAYVGFWQGSVKLDRVSDDTSRAEPRGLKDPLSVSRGKPSGPKWAHGVELKFRSSSRGSRPLRGAASEVKVPAPLPPELMLPEQPLRGKAPIAAPRQRRTLLSYDNAGNC